MGKLDRVWGLVCKETYQIVRDPSSIVIAFILPVMLIFLFGYAVSLDVQNLKIGLVLEDTNPDINLLSESFNNSNYFDAKIAHDRHKVEELILADKLRGIVVVPDEFDRDLAAADKSAQIQVIADGSETNTAALLQNYVQGVWGNWLQQKQIQKGQEFKPPISNTVRIWYNPEANSRFFLLPGSIAIIMTLIGTLLTSLVIAREWERGTMEALMATPVTIGEIIWGKIIPYYFLGLGSMIACVIMAVYVFGVPLRGSLWLLSLVTSLYLGTALSLGLLISTVAHNQFLASQISLYAAYLPSFLLSGFLFEISSMPDILQFITRFIPARYFVNSLQTLFLTGDVYALIAINCLWITLFGFILIILVMRRVRKRLD